MSKKKNFPPKSSTTESLIEILLDNNSKVSFSEVENGVINEYVLFIDDKKVVQSISVRRCLEDYFAF